MVTKLVYFRPDKRFVKDDVLENKYTCLIKDKFTTAETSITVPIYLTVFQHHTPKNCMRQRKLRKEKQLSSTKFQEKLSFYLVGSSQLPPLHELISHTRNIDRVEFIGHVGFENPVFELISKLPALRKITFVVIECKQGNFIFDVNADDDKVLIRSTCSKMVTNLSIDVKICKGKSCLETSCRKGNSFRNNHESQENILDSCTAGASAGGKDGSLEKMLIRLLQRTAKQCPNIKRVTMDVPNYNDLRKVIENFVQEMTLLKPTKISCINNRILVSKHVTETFHPEDDNQTSGVIPEKLDDQPNIDDVITSNSTNADQEPTSTGTKTVNALDIENTDTLNNNNDSLEPTPCLFDMSKLLGSMLGIPTSSLPLPSLSASSSSHSSSSLITQAPLNELTIADKQSADTSASEATKCNIDFQPVSATVEGSMNSSANNQTSSSSVEVITYAAAAASAAATSANLTPTTTCNGSTNRHHHNHTKNGSNGIGSHHRHHHHHINEGSRRTFIKDGEGPGLRGDEDEISTRAKQNKNIRKPSNTHVADLGKPVFISSSCKSPHKRAV